MDKTVLASNFNISILSHRVSGIREYKFNSRLNTKVYLYEIEFEDEEDKLQDNYKVVDAHWMKDDIISITLVKTDNVPCVTVGRSGGIIMACCNSSNAAILNSLSNTCTFTYSTIRYGGGLVKITGKRIKNNFKRMITYKEKLYFERIRPYNAAFVKVVNGEYDPDNSSVLVIESIDKDCLVACNDLYTVTLNCRKGSFFPHDISYQVYRRLMSKFDFMIIDKEKCMDMIFTEFGTNVFLEDVSIDINGEEITIRGVLDKDPVNTPVPKLKGGYMDNKITDIEDKDKSSILPDTMIKMNIFGDRFKNARPNFCRTKATNNTNISGLEIKDVKFSGDRTIVFWKNGTKTIVRMQDDEAVYDPEKAIMAAYMKKALTILGHWEDSKSCSMDKILDKYLAKYEQDKQEIEAGLQRVKQRKAKKHISNNESNDINESTDVNNSEE